MLNVGGFLKNKFKGLSQSMTGQKSAFAPPAMQAPMQASGPLPQISPPVSQPLQSNFGFGDLATYEEGRRNAFAGDIQKQMTDRRAQLATSLTDQGNQLFKQSMPGILEDLNRRGLATSTSEVNNSNATALKDIALKNQNVLTDFDNSAFQTNLQAQQDALDSGLDLRRSELEARLGSNSADREEQLARDLAKQQGKNELTGSLIGLGGNLAAGGAFNGIGKSLAGLFGKGAAGAVPGVSGVPGAIGPTLPGTVPATGLGLGGALAGGAAIGAAGLGAMELAKQGEKIGGTPGAILANPIGAQLNVAKKVGKSIKKAFCFDAHTPVSMSDGSTKHIMNVNLGDQVVGGQVLSVRASICADGELHDYLGVTVTGSHAVYENGAWIRVGDSPYSVPIPGQSIVYSLVTTAHRLRINDITFADEFETDDWEDLTIDESLERLNEPAGVN